MKKISLVSLLFSVLLTYARAEDDKIDLQFVESNVGGESARTLSGNLTTLYTIGSTKNDQKLTPISGVGGLMESKQNGFYTALNFSILYKLVSFAELSLTMLVRNMPGSPYIPMQLEKARAESFSVAFDSVYGRINVIKGL
jgi:hypothetical protein